MPQLILASRSPRRRQLLEQAGLKPEIVPAEVDEALHEGEPPEAYVLRLAEEKARVVAGSFPPGSGVLVLGADTAVVVDEVVLGKPADLNDGRRMLRSLSGRRHKVITGYAIVPVPGPTQETDARAKPLPEVATSEAVTSEVVTSEVVTTEVVTTEVVTTEVVTTEVEFKDLGDDEIDDYLATGEPLDKAGAYAIQGAGAFMIRRIDGSHSNVIGLPICEVVEALRRLGRADHPPGSGPD
jgi:septum formation protein